FNFSLSRAEFLLKQVLEVISCSSEFFRVVLDGFQFLLVPMQQVSQDGNLDLSLFLRTFSVEIFIFGMGELVQESLFENHLHGKNKRPGVKLRLPGFSVRQFLPFSL